VRGGAAQPNFIITSEVKFAGTRTSGDVPNRPNVHLKGGTKILIEQVTNRATAFNQSVSRPNRNKTEKNRSRKENCLKTQVKGGLVASKVAKPVTSTPGGEARRDQMGSVGTRGEGKYGLGQ